MMGLLSVSNLGRGLIPSMTTGSSSQDFIEAVNIAQKTFEASTEALQANQIDRLTVLRADTAKALDRLRKIPSLIRNLRFLLRGLIRLMQNQYELMQEVQNSRTITFGAARRLKQNEVEYEKIMGQFSQWAQTEGSPLWNPDGKTPMSSGILFTSSCLTRSPPENQ